MKKYLLILLLTLNCVFVYAQTPLDSFYKQGTWWCEYEWHSAGFSTWWAAGYNFRIGDDTIINSTTYHKLLLDNKVFGGIRTTGEQVHFIRTDTLQYSGRLHSYVVNSFTLNQDTILYDFNLVVGDTLKWVSQNQKVVSGIDSVQLSNGKYAKRYMFGDSYWIRGPGSSQGLFGAHIKAISSAPIAPGGLSYLQYYESVNTSITINIPAGEHSSPSYCFSNSVNYFAKEGELLSLYPNPSNGSVTVEGSIQSAEANLVIYNTFGQVVYAVKEAINNNYINRKIDLQNLPKGVYRLVLQADAHMQTLPFVVE